MRFITNSMAYEHKFTNRFDRCSLLCSNKFGKQNVCIPSYVVVETVKLVVLQRFSTYNLPFLPCFNGK